MRPRKWSESDLRNAVESSVSIRQVIGKLGLVEAGGNYVQVKEWIKKLSLDTTHFTGMAWSKGKTGIGRPIYALDDILVEDSSFQSFKLKKRLFEEGIFEKKCVKCGWAKVSADGRMPLELDHINGNHRDNRITNLRILCPNCHSLEPTHRGRNKKQHYKGPVA